MTPLRHHIPKAKYRIGRRAEYDASPLYQQKDETKTSRKFTLEGTGNFWTLLTGNFSTPIDNPRTGTATLHDFHELLMIAMCAVLCGGQSSMDIGLSAVSKGPFLVGVLMLCVW